VPRSGFLVVVDRNAVRVDRRGRGREGGAEAAAGGASLVAMRLRVRLLAAREVSLVQYAQALYGDADATLDDLREAVTTLEETERTARRVFGGAYPLTPTIEAILREARDALRASETPSSSP